METHKVCVQMFDLRSISYSGNVNAIFQFFPCMPQLWLFFLIKRFAYNSLYLCYFTYDSLSRPIIRYCLWLIMMCGISRLSSERRYDEGASDCWHQSDGCRGTKGQRNRLHVQSLQPYQLTSPVNRKYFRNLLLAFPGQGAIQSVPFKRSPIHKLIPFAVIVFSKISAAIGLEFLQRCEAYHISKQFDTRHFACHKRFLHPEMLLPVGVLLSYLVLTCHGKHYKMLQEDEQTTSMRSNVPERTHILLVSTLFSHLLSFLPDAWFTPSLCILWSTPCGFTYASRVPKLRRRSSYI
jgi:hypothetical protein